MQFDKIEELREAFPDIFDVKDIADDWLDDVHIIDRYDNYPDPFEDELFPDSENQSQTCQTALSQSMTMNNYFPI